MLPTSTELMVRGSLDDTLAPRLEPAQRARWRRAEQSGEAAALGQRLRHLGLSQRAITHTFGVRTPVHAPWRAMVMAAEDASGTHGPRPIPPAALMVHLWVAGHTLPRAKVQARLGDDYPLLLELGLLAHASDDAVAATVAIVPAGESLVVSDRAEITRGREVAQYADDSAFHMIGVTPTRATRPGQRWLDVGTGSAIVPLARPGAASRILGTDINPRAIAMARLGAALSGARHMEMQVADLLQAAHDGAPWDLITFNAPIPGGDDHDSHDSSNDNSDTDTDVGGTDDTSFGRPVPPPSTEETPWYRYGAEDILSRFWTEVRPLVASDGEVLVHSVLPQSGLPPWLELPGDVVVARYSPSGSRPVFGVSVWRPGGPATHRQLAIELDGFCPHVTRASLG